MDIEDVFDLLELTAEAMKPYLGMTGSYNCDSCEDAALASAISVLRAISKKHTITKAKG
jgi:hypothetical protein